MVRAIQTTHHTISRTTNTGYTMTASHHTVQSRAQACGRLGAKMGWGGVTIALGPKIYEKAPLLPA